VRRRERDGADDSGNADDADVSDVSGDSDDADVSDDSDDSDDADVSDLSDDADDSDGADDRDDACHSGAARGSVYAACATCGDHAGEAEAGRDVHAPGRAEPCRSSYGHVPAARARVHAVIMGATAVAVVALVAPAAHSAAGARLGTLEIPKIGLHQTLYQGVSAHVLAGGPGHYVGTSMPGARGTVGIAGHRTTHTRPFGRLNRLRAGDRVTIKTAGGTYVYRVYRMRIVPPHQVWPLRPGRFQQVVLTACHPPTSARFRIVVFASRVYGSR